MELKTVPVFAATTIHDRSGRRVGTYLVDKSQDSLNREQKNKQSKNNKPNDEEAVVFHHSESRETKSTEEVESKASSEESPLNLTV